MNTKITFVLLFAVLSAFAYGQNQRRRSDTQSDPLNERVERFALTDATLIEGLSKLSEQQVPSLHLGIEEILSESFSNPASIVRFSLNLENATVRELLDQLCQHDNRYAWSTDGLSINVYARENIDNPLFFLNRKLHRITLHDIPNTNQALTPLAKLLPKEQIGYSGVGGDPSYLEPWTITFEHVTVRQLMNRVSEHMGPRSTWILSGTRNERMFFFTKGSFH
jgi:hypothetical protein